MYSVLINSMYWLEIGKYLIGVLSVTSLVAFGVLLIIGMWDAPEKVRTVPLSFSGLACFIGMLTFMMVVSPLFDIKWQVARIIAPKVDEYIKSSPDTLLDATNIVKYGDRLVQDLSVTVLDYIKKGE